MNKDYTWEELLVSIKEVRKTSMPIISMIDKGLLTPTENPADRQRDIEAIKTVDIDLQSMVDFIGERTGVVTETDMSSYSEMAEELLLSVNEVTKLSNSLLGTS